MKYSGPPIVKVACGGEFSMILDCKGVLYSFGSPEYGQLGKLRSFTLILLILLINLYISLGHGTNGEYIAQANKVSYNTEKVAKRIPMFVEKGRDNRPNPVEYPEIIDISCGTNHTV